MIRIPFPLQLTAAVLLGVLAVALCPPADACDRVRACAPAVAAPYTPAVVAPVYPTVSAVAVQAYPVVAVPLYSASYSSGSSLSPEATLLLQQLVQQQQAHEQRLARLEGGGARPLLRNDAPPAVMPPAADAAPGRVGIEPPDVLLQGQGRPAILTKCATCHSEGRLRGTDLTLFDVAGALKALDSRTQAKVLRSVERGQMPKNGPPPTEEEVEALEDFFAGAK